MEKSDPWKGSPLGWAGTLLGVLTVVGLVLCPRPTLWFLLVIAYMTATLALITFAWGPKR